MPVNSPDRLRGGRQDTRSGPPSRNGERAGTRPEGPRSGNERGPATEAGVTLIRGLDTTNSPMKPGPVYRRLREAGMPRRASEIITVASVAAVTQPPETIAATDMLLDKQTQDPAIRTRVSDQGTMADIRGRTHSTTSEGLVTATDINVRAETGVRVVELELAKVFNELYGPDPNKAGSVALEAEAVALTDVIIREALTNPIFEVYPDLRVPSPNTDAIAPELETAQLAAIIGVTMDLGNPYRREMPQYEVFDVAETPLQRAGRHAERVRRHREAQKDKKGPGTEPPSYTEALLLPEARRLKPASAIDLTPDETLVQKE